MKFSKALVSTRDMNYNKQLKEAKENIILFFYLSIHTKKFRAVMDGFELLLGDDQSITNIKCITRKQIPAVRSKWSIFDLVHYMGVLVHDMNLKTRNEPKHHYSEVFTPWRI